MMYLKLFEQYITERYSNISELKTLTEDILLLMAKDIAYGFSANSRNGYEHNIKDIFKKIDIEKYHNIQGFIKDDFVKSISVTIIPDEIVRGYYIDSSGDIKLNLNPTRNDLKTLHGKDEKDIYYLLYGLHNTLIHELQHAYDDYRSDGKYVKKGYNNEIENLEAYYRSDHELNAHFTDIISSMEFYTTDFEETPTSLDDGIVIVIRKINDFDIIKQNFIKNFEGWSYLTEDIKKKMLRQLGKYYIMVNEKIKKYNQEKHTKSFY